MHLKGNYDEGALSHELKHAYQFQNRTMSFGKDGSGFALYDREDEREAFTRGEAYGDNRSFEYLISLGAYKDLKDKQIKWSTTNIAGGETRGQFMIRNNAEQFIKNPTINSIPHFFYGWRENLAISILTIFGVW